MLCDGVAKNADTCLQADSEQQMHREEQTMMLKSPGGTRAMGQDLALGHRRFRDLEGPSEVVDSTQTLRQSELQRVNSLALKLVSSLPLYPWVASPSASSSRPT